MQSSAHVANTFPYSNLKTIFSLSRISSSTRVPPRSLPLTNHWISSSDTDEIATHVTRMPKSNLMDKSVFGGQEGYQAGWGLNDNRSIA